MPATAEPTLVLSRSDVLALLSLPECVEAVERAFRAHAEARTLAPAVVGVRSGGGGFHIKTAGLLGPRGYFAAKANGNFPGNADRGLPTIRGTVLLADAADGRPLAVMDSASITALRTGAATAVAARHLARPDVRSALVVGCGVQGEIQLAALAAVLPLERARVLDLDPVRAAALATRAGRTLGLPVQPVADLAAALGQSDVCVTCTPARRAFVSAVDVRPGTFIAAVGADSEGKQELEPALVASATLVVDLLEQCAELGELQHALAAGLLRRQDVHAELADLVTGRRPGRTRPEEITVFDSTGTALQDVAAAVVVYEKARAAGRGVEVHLDG